MFGFCPICTSISFSSPPALRARHRQGWPLLEGGRQCRQCNAKGEVLCSHNGVSGSQRDASPRSRALLVRVSSLFHAEGAGKERERDRPGWKEKEDARCASPDRLPLIRSGVLRPSGLAFLRWNCPSPFASNHLQNMCTKIRGRRIRISIYQRKTMFNPSDLSPPFRFFTSGHKNSLSLLERLIWERSFERESGMIAGSSLGIGFMVQGKACGKAELPRDRGNTITI